MKAISITLILLVFAIGCQEIPSKNDSKEESIIGEWYEIGLRNPNVNRRIVFKKPFKKYKYLLRYIFTKDSVYTHAVDNQVLNSSLSIIENGNIRKGGACKYVRIERNTYRPCESSDEYFEIKGDTLIKYWYRESFKDIVDVDTNTPIMFYYFKKTN